MRTVALSQPVFSMACSGDLQPGPARDSQRPTAGSAVHTRQPRRVCGRLLGTAVGMEYEDSGPVESPLTEGIRFNLKVLCGLLALYTSG